MTPLLEGLLVDLVPYGARFLAQEHTWHNSEAWFWGSAGDRPIRSRATIERDQAENAAHQGPRQGVMFGIQTKTGVPIGDIGLGWMMPHHRLAMFGAGIGDPAYWGGGYGTDALLLAVDYAFNWLDLHKVWLSTMSQNARVVRQMEKVGFVPEGRRRAFWYADGQYYDDLVYGLLRGEWPGRAAVIARIGLRARADTAQDGEH